MPLYVFRRPADPADRPAGVGAIPQASITVVDTTYTAGTVIPTQVSTGFTAGGEVQAAVSTPITAGGAVKASVSVQFTLGGAVKVTIDTAYTLGSYIANVINTSVSAGGAVKATASTQYTAGAVVTMLTARTIYPIVPGASDASIVDFWLCDAFGNVLSVIGPDVYIEAEYSLAVNSVTQASLILPPDFDYNLIHDDGWLLPMRRVGRGAPILDGEAPFLVTARGKRMEASGGKMIELHADRATSILARRIVAYSSEGSYAAKGPTPADSLCVAVVKENYGTLALDTTRNISKYLAVYPNPTTPALPNADLQMSRRAVLDCLTEAAQASAAQDQELFFDVVLDSWGAKRLAFATYRGQRGRDLTRRPGTASRSDPYDSFTLSSSFGTITNVVLLEEYGQTYNFVYARGQGQGDQTLTTSLQDAALVGRGPFARKETMYSSNQTITPTSLVSEARAALRQGRPRQYISCDIPSTAMYGRRWRFGDKLGVEHEGVVFKVHAQAVNVRIAEGKEEVRASLRAEVVL